MTPDSELLSRYARTRSEDAFAELVRRHVNLVYSAALRQVNGDAHLAQDVAQTVFTDLARKAASLARRETLTGWLYTSAHHAAAKIVRMENRRRDREEKFMREPISETVEVGRVTPCAPDWEQLRPVLDEVMHQLKETDREAILLRFFENRQFAEVGAKLGLNENAARMRVERALEKLRAAFLRRGVAATTALASVISANAVQLAPANLAVTLTTTSLSAAGTGTFTLLNIMTATQLKLGISVLVVAGAATALVVQHQTQTRLGGENHSLRQQISRLQTDNESLSNRLATAADSNSLPDKQFNELLRLRGEVGVLRNQVADLGKTHDRDQRILASLVRTGTNEMGNLKASISGGITYKINFDSFFQAIGRPPPSATQPPATETIEGIRNYLKQHGANIEPTDKIFLNSRLQQIYVGTAFTNKEGIDAVLSGFYTADQRPQETP